MKKKLLIAMVLCVLAMCLFAISVNAECTEHTYKWTVDVGNNGFLGEITAEGVCSACEATVSETIPSVFVALGYSSSSDGVVQSYAVNRKALAKYEELTGEKVKFGAVVTTRKAIGSSNPLNSKGEPVSEKVKIADFTDTKYDIIDVAVKGIPSELKGNADILFAMYVNAGGRITYLDNCIEKTFCGARSYDNVVANPEAEAPALNSSMFVDKQRYEQIDLDFTLGYFWNGSTFQTSNDVTFRNRYWGTNDSFTKDTLPNGSIIYVDSANGWQYRPHKWSGERPYNTKDSMVVVDDAWWGSFTYVGFNISLYKGEGPSETNKDYESLAGYTSEQIGEIFKIYLPVTTTSSDDNTGSDDSGATTPEETPDYSAEKQNWNDDNTLKILAIGNSFSVDSMEYVYQVAQSAGIENVVLGNLYIGGCTLATHLSNAQNNSGAYTYYTNSSGSWSSTSGVSIKTAVESDDWDFISFQQASGYSGISSTYSDLVALMNIVEPLNPSAKLVWHMTWAYQADSSHSDFSKYNKNQTTMYNAIIDAVQTNILTNDRISIIIPAGTSIQNARTSYIGDTLTRDGFHLSDDLGRFIGSLTFVKALTGVSIDSVAYMPSGVDENELLVAIESVNNACNTPFSVTASSYTTEPETEGGDTSGETGVITGYTQLTATDMGLMEDSFYNTQGSNTFGGTDAFSSGYYATKKFTKEELPVGTIIEIADGWQYRPEGWSWAGSRPDNVKTSKVVIDEAWWGTYTERAFNISQVGHTQDNIKAITITVDEMANSIFKISVPTFSEDGSTDSGNTDSGSTGGETDTTVYVKSSDCAEEIVTIDGKEYRALTITAMGLTAQSYYYSVVQGPTFYVDDSSTAKKFFGTGVFTKDNLPNGAIIWVNSGWQYRPEGWKSEDSLNSNSTRPGNVSTTYVTVDEAWWGNWTIRGFNISKTGTPEITSLSLEDVYANFKIYIPVENITEEVAQ